MPWCAIPFEDSRIVKLASHFNIKGVPALVLLDEENELITVDGRIVLSNDPEGKHFPWQSGTVDELNEDNASLLNDGPCIVVFTGGDNELLSKALSSLSDTARVYNVEQKKRRDSSNPLPHLNFFYEGPASREVADQLKSFIFGSGLLGLEVPQKSVTLLDIPEQRVYSRDNEAAVDCLMCTSKTRSLHQLVEDFKNNRLPFVPLQNCNMAASTDNTNNNTSQNW
jgi:hypothetical protein